MRTGDLATVGLGVRGVSRVNDQADGKEARLIQLREREPSPHPPLSPSSNTYLNHHFGGTQGGDSRGTQRSRRQGWARHD